MANIRKIVRKVEFGEEVVEFDEKFRVISHYYIINSIFKS